MLDVTLTQSGNWRGQTSYRRKGTREFNPQKLQMNLQPQGKKVRRKVHDLWFSQLLSAKLTLLIGVPVSVNWSQPIRAFTFRYYQLLLFC